MREAFSEVASAATSVLYRIPQDPETRRFLPSYVHALENCAIDWIENLHCGCGEKSFECCCDVNKVKDIIIHHMQLIEDTWVSAVGMDGSYDSNVLGKICYFGRFDSILNRATHAIHEIMDDYSYSLFHGYYKPVCKLREKTYCPHADVIPDEDIDEDEIEEDNACGNICDSGCSGALPGHGIPYHGPHGGHRELHGIDCAHMGFNVEFLGSTYNPAECKTVFRWELVNPPALQNMKDINPKNAIVPPGLVLGWEGNCCALEMTFQETMSSGDMSTIGTCWEDTLPVNGAGKQTLGYKSETDKGGIYSLVVAGDVKTSAPSFNTGGITYTIQVGNQPYCTGRTDGPDCGDVIWN